MYRQMIEHPGPDGGRDVPNVPYEILRKYGMRAGSTMGRIYRVSPKGRGPMRRPRLSDAAPAELAAHLGDDAGWWRDTAQRLILEAPASADVKAIEAVAATAKPPAARAQALWTLEALGRLESRHVAVALEDAVPGVREAAVRLAEPRPVAAPELLDRLPKMGNDDRGAARFQLALTLGETAAPQRIEVLARVADEPYTRAAVLSAAGNGVGLYRALLAGRLRQSTGAARLVSETARLVGAAGEASGVEAVPLTLGEKPHDDADWLAAATLEGLAQGLKLSGAKDLDVAAAAETLRVLTTRPAEPVRRAAGEVASHVRLLDAAARAALVDPALNVLADASAPPARRRDAARDLAAGTFDRVGAPLAGLLDVRNPEEVQRAALSSLDAHANPGVVAQLVRRWDGLTPSVKAEATGVAIARSERIGPFLEALIKGDVPAADIDGETRARLLNLPDVELAQKAAAVFNARANCQDATLLERYKPALGLPGKPAGGRVVFQNRCATCHQLAGEGVAVGPDLASVRTHTFE